MPPTTALVMLMEGASLLFMTIMLVQFHRIHSRRKELLVSLGAREKLIQSIKLQKHICMVIYIVVTITITIVSIGMALLWPHFLS